MKKLNLLAICVLATAVAGVAQQTTSSSQPAPQQPAPGDQANAPAQPQQKKEIKDPAEYNAYVNAIGLQNPADKANALKQFINQYPNSVVKEDAQEQLMAAYQQAGNMPEAQKAAEDVLKTNPNNVRALLVLAYINRLKAQSGDITAAPLALKYGQQGLQALPNYTKPDSVPDADFQKFKAIAALVFNGAVGIGALNAKDYPTAEKALQTAYDMEISANPNDPDAWLNAYPLATAFCSTKPPDVRGPWYAARSVVLTKNNPAANRQISDYAQHCYRYYHGDNDGWDQVLASANQPTPPSNLAEIVKPAPSPAEQVEKLAAKDRKDQSFDDWMQIIVYGKPETVDRVWNAIKGTPLAFQAKVVEADKDKLLLAATYDNSHDTPPKADTEVVMAGPIPPAKIPKVGSDIAVVATPESFDKQPYMMHLDNGKLAVQKGSTPPATTHRPTRRARR